MLAAVLLAALAPTARAGLLSPAAEGSGDGPKIAGLPAMRRLVLDRRTLGRLRTQQGAVVHDFPLGSARTVDLVLERFDPFTPGARAEVLDRGRRRHLRLPDQAYFKGTVADEPDSHVLLIAGRSRVHGFIISGGEVFPFGPDQHGSHRSYALREADPSLYPPPQEFCANDLHPEAVDIPASAQLAALAAAPPVAAAPGTVKQANIAIETDRELRAKFSTDAEALEYLSSLAAAATAIYERDVAVRLRFSYIRLWGASPADPWSSTDPSGTLTQLRNYWNDPANDMAHVAGPRTTVHFLSGKPVRGGVAYLDVLCNPAYGYGVSQVYGDFDLSDPTQIWDVLVFTHELGHNFGSPHSHCYSPPVDECYNRESGCYSGPVVASRGTIMSYCHQVSGGLSNVDLLFGNAVSARIGESVAEASCLATVAAGSTTTTSTTATTTTTRRATTTTRPPTTTTRPATTTTSSTVTTRPSTTTTTRSTTTTTMIPGDRDGDGVPDGTDACPRSIGAEVVDARGCSACPCAGPAFGTPWPSRAAYIHCVRLAIAPLDHARRSEVYELAHRSSCARTGRTRCCSYRTADATEGRCRLFRADSCAARAEVGRAVDLGPGSCAAVACTR